MIFHRSFNHFLCDHNLNKLKSLEEKLIFIDFYCTIRRKEISLDEILGAKKLPFVRSKYKINMRWQYQSKSIYIERKFHDLCAKKRDLRDSLDLFCRVNSLWTYLCLPRASGMIHERSIVYRKLYETL